jgi:ABC-type bacteriocin/lantibiotic exporter with double-glycine peptidase domain
MKLLPVSHHPQQRQADCLAACAYMVLAYQNQSVPYDRLLTLLRIGAAGAPYRNLRYLESAGLTVQIQQGEIADLQDCLAKNIPPIIFVNTAELPYWSEAAGHALVVVGIDETSIFINDPVFPDAPKSLNIADLELAWLEMDQFFAVFLAS